MSGASLKVTNTIDQSAPPSLRIDDAPREANERNLFSDFAGPVIVFILFIASHRIDQPSHLQALN
jgi:hypothetical protein